MNAATWLAITRILAELHENLARILKENAARSYLFGNFIAAKRLGLDLGGEAAIAGSVEYARRYGEMLVAEGASIIGGQKVPWLSAMSATERARIVDIIDQGLKEGKYPGVKELKRGGYAKDTIANDLDGYFQTRRSHASMVARTETGRILNIGSLDRYRAEGVRRVRVYDNEGPNSCDACRRANGQIWDIEYAMRNELQHPNCVRVFGAVAD